MDVTDSESKVEPVRVAFAGCGGVTKDVLEVIADYPDLKLVAVQDVNPEAAAGMAGAFGILKHYTDFEDLLAAEIDFVVINTPNHLHHPMAIQALESGKHVLVQKPIARNSAEAREMIAAAESAGKLLGVAMEELGNSIYRQMRGMIQAGCIGEIVEVQSMVAHTRHMRNPLDEGDWRLSPDLVGGGSFIQLAIHHLNLAQWMLGDEIVEVGAKSTSLHCSESFPCDETTVSWVRFGGGALGTFASSFACDADVFFVHGTNGFIGHRGDRIVWEVKEPFDGEVWCCDNACEPGHLEIEWYHHRPTRIKPEYEQHRRFALATRGECEVEVPGKVGLRDLLIVEAVHKAAREGAAVVIKENT